MTTPAMAPFEIVGVGVDVMGVAAADVDAAVEEVVEDEDDVEVEVEDVTDGDDELLGAELVAAADEKVAFVLVYPSITTAYACAVGL